MLSNKPNASTTPSASIEAVFGYVEKVWISEKKH